MADAREGCQYWWMKEALDILVRRLTFEKHNNKEEEEENAFPI